MLFVEKTSARNNCKFPNQSSATASLWKSTRSTNSMSKEYLEPSQYDLKVAGRVTNDDLYAWLCEIEWIRPVKHAKKYSFDRSGYKKRWHTKRDEFNSHSDSFYRGSGHDSKRARHH